MSVTHVSIDNISSYDVPVSPVPVRTGVDLYPDWLLRTELPEAEVAGFPTSCWGAFNTYFGGARSELVIVTGETGMGKTSWCLTWFKDVLDQGRKACILPMEMGTDDTMDQFSEMVLGVKNYQVGDKERTIFGQTLEEWPLYVVDHHGMLEENLVHKAIHYTAKEHGVKFFLVDHVEYIEKGIQGRNEAYVIDDCCRRLASLAHSLKVCIVLIVHPSKRDKGARKGMLELDDLKGTSGLKQTAGSVLVHYRPEETKDETYIYLAKIRSRSFSKYRGKKIRFGYDQFKSTYVEAHHD